MKRKLLIILAILFVLSIVIGTSPIVDYFYSLADSVETATQTTDGTVQLPETVNPKTVVFAVVLSSLTVIVCLIVYLKKRKG